MDEHSPFSAATFKPKNAFTPLSNQHKPYVFACNPILIAEESKDESSPTLREFSSVSRNQSIIKEQFYYSMPIHHETSAENSPKTIISSGDQSYITAQLRNKTYFTKQSMTEDHTQKSLSFSRSNILNKIDQSSIYLDQSDLSNRPARKQIQIIKPIDNNHEAIMRHKKIPGPSV